MSRRYLSPRLLEPDHGLEDFDCRSVEQSEWLRRHARQAQASGTARVLVVVESGTTEVVAYYAWAMATIAVADAPQRMRRGAGRNPQPIALLARLGVSIPHEGQGLGAGLLRDVIARTADLGAAEFEPSPTDELHLVLLMKDVRRSLGVE